MSRPPSSTLFPYTTLFRSHGERSDRFARAGLADDADGLTLGDGEIDVLDRAHDAAARGKLDRQALDVEQRDRRRRITQIGRASGRERVQVSGGVVGVT